MRLLSTVRPSSLVVALCPTGLRWSWLSAVLSLLLFVGLHAQSADAGAISGTVIESWQGQPLGAVTVSLRGTTLAVTTDAQGRYTLQPVPPGDHVVRFSKSGYAGSVATDVRVAASLTTKVDATLRPEFYEMEEYEVVAEVVEEQAAVILQERQDSSLLLDAIGSDQFSKLGAGDAAEVLGKVTGASVADGKFAVIRGLADRYTSTTLNGNDIPSADPDRKAAQLDLFPSQFIERMDVSKTFSPDMPGGFAGGSINIVTKSFPDKPFINFSLGTSYNTQSSLRDDFLETDHGSTDWLGMDDGTRELPAAAAATNPAGTAAPLNPAIKDSFGSRQFAPTVGSSPLNTSLSLDFGGATKVLDRKLGFMAGVSYDVDYTHYDGEEITKTESQFSSPPREDAKVGGRSVIEYTWASMVSLGYEISENHEIGFNFLVVQAAEDEAKRYFGESNDPDTSGPPYFDTSELHWTERQLQYYQLRGGHDFPELQDVRLEWAGSMATTSQDEPDHRFFQFYADPESNFYNPDGPSQPPRPTRIFRELTEDNASFRTDLTLPLPSYNEKDNSVKFGGAISKSERDYFSRGYDVRMRSGHPFFTTGDPNSYLAPENNAFVNYHNFAANFEYTGEQTITAWYGMADWATLEWLRLTGGARVESTDISVDTVNRTTGSRSFSSIRQDDVLPSLAATISIRTNLLLRAAWSQTVIRPTYREISDAEIYDVARERIYQGNPELTMSDSQNYDLRLEWYPREGELISVGVFLKNIGDPIELVSEDVSNDRVTYDNFEEAEVRGIEFEFRKNLGTWSPALEELSLGFNYAFMESEVPIPADQQNRRRAFRTDYSTTRPLYDQPEFVTNGDITWDHKATGTAVTLSGGVVGRRLVLVGIASPDEYEEPAPTLDFFISQKLSKNWKAKFSAKNLLNPKHEVSVTYPDYGKYIVETYTKGITFGISLSAEF